MHYSKAEFVINGSAALLQPSRELLADAIAEAGFESFEDTERGLDAYAQTDLLDRVAIDEAIAQFPFEDVVITYSITAVEDENYNKAWEAEGFDLIEIENVIIYDANHSSAPEAELAIGIAAEQAFGTGTHQTTRLMVRQLLHTELQGKRLLDCGCGTGILGIVASKLGASEVVGYDIDEWSVSNTARNCQLNDVQNMEVLQGDSTVLSHVSGVFDVVVANINRNILLSDMAAFKDVMNIGATLILSGFYEADAPILAEAASELGLEVRAKAVDGDWCMLAMR